MRLKRDGSFGYEKSQIGLDTLNTILLEELCARAGLPRKTSHCLRITCATSLFQNSVEKKIARQRTGHTSNALLNTSCPVGSNLMEQAQFLAQAKFIPMIVIHKVVSSLHEEKENGSVLDDGCSEF